MVGNECLKRSVCHKLFKNWLFSLIFVENGFKLRLDTKFATLDWEKSLSKFRRLTLVLLVQKRQSFFHHAERFLLGEIIHFFGGFFAPKKHFSGRKICFSAKSSPFFGSIFLFFGKRLAFLFKFRHFAMPKNERISASIPFFGMFFGDFGGRLWCVKTPRADVLRRQ